MSTTEALDMEIRSLVTELMESAPLAPSLLELESRDASPRRSRYRRAPWSNRHVGWQWPLFGAVVVATLLMASYSPLPLCSHPMPRRRSCDALPGRPLSPSRCRCCRMINGSSRSFRSRTWPLRPIAAPNPQRSKAPERWSP